MSVADLTGTAWRFNNSLTSVGSDVGTYSLNFESNGNQYTQMIVALGKPSITLSYNSTTAYSSNAWNTYGGADYQTISITGGTAATNANIIAFIERNATQVVLTHDVTISYNNSTIAYLDASGTEVLETNGTICSDDITVEYTKPTPSLQAKTNISPTTSSQTITADGGYDGLSSVQINAMPTQTLPSSATSGVSGTYKASLSSSTSTKYLNIPTGYNATAQYYSIPGEPNLIAENIKKDVTILGVTGTYEGGGAGTPTLSTSVPQYMVNVALVTYGQYRDSVPGYYVPPVGETVYFDTAGRWELSSLYEEATGTPVPFTTISTSRNGSKYSFVMPNAAVLFDLYYND